MASWNLAIQYLEIKHICLAAQSLITFAGWLVKLTLSPLWYEIKWNHSTLSSEKKMSWYLYETLNTKGKHDRFIYRANEAIAQKCLWSNSEGCAWSHFPANQQIYTRASCLELLVVYKYLAVITEWVSMFYNIKWNQNVDGKLTYFPWHPTMWLSHANRIIFSNLISLTCVIMRVPLVITISV